MKHTGILYEARTDPNCIVGYDGTRLPAPVVCGHYHRSIRTALACADRLDRRFDREGAYHVVRVRGEWTAEDELELERCALEGAGKSGSGRARHEKNQP